jgi:hypothetical protein
MKATINILLATLAISLMASAAPALLLETTITDHADTNKDVLSTPRITVENGKPAIIKVGKLEYSITPTLLDDGAVDIHITLTQGEDKKADKLVVPSVKTRFGIVATLQVGQLALTIKPSLAKRP